MKVSELWYNCGLCDHAKLRIKLGTHDHNIPIELDMTNGWKKEILVATKDMDPSTEIAAEVRHNILIIG